MQTSVVCSESVNTKDWETELAPDMELIMTSATQAMPVQYTRIANHYIDVTAEGPQVVVTMEPYLIISDGMESFNEYKIRVADLPGNEYGEDAVTIFSTERGRSVAERLEPDIKPQTAKQRNRADS